MSPSVLRPPVPVHPVPPVPPVLSLVDSAPFGETASADTGSGETSATAWTGGFAYQPENHYGGYVRDPVDLSSLDLPALVNPIAAPTGVGSITGGTLTAAGGPYTYKVTALDANGETLPSPVSAGIAVASGTTGSVTLTWSVVEFATSYRVYGRSGTLGLLASGVVPVSGQAATVSWTDNGSASPGAVVPVANTTGGAGSYSNLGIVTFYPFLVIAEDACSSFGFEAHDYKGRATRLVNNAARAAIEREFWGGYLAQAGGYPNNYLTNSSDPAWQDLTPGGGPPSVARGQQILEDALQQCGFGGQGMIHTQAQTAPNLLSARLVDGDRPGTQRLLSVLGNIIIPGSGYTGLGPGNSVPTAGTAYMYATDLVTVRMESDDDVSVFPDTYAEALDRKVNKVVFRAEKYAAASWDGACHFGCRVTLAT